MKIDSKMKILLAGPYVGEFGWELFCWQAYIRRLSKDFDKTIVIGRPTNEAMYSDFCDEYIKFDPQSFKTEAFRCFNAKSAEHLIKSIPHTTYQTGNFDIGMHYHGRLIDSKGWFYSKQEFHKFESDVSDKGYDVIFHCRNKSVGPERNWGLGKWVELKHLLGDNLKIACIGNEEAFHVKGTDDLRGIDLSELISIMNNSKMIVGPSSGPMHLASLCGLKHLVWTTEFNRSRYTKDWNPFNTEVILHVDGGWDPEPEKIKIIIENQFNEYTINGV